MTARPFRLTVKVFVTNDEGRCLLLRRSQHSTFFPGQWDLPGGAVDGNETLDEALHREILEETGLTVRIDRVVGAAQAEMPAIRVALLFLEAREVSGEMRLSREHDACQWVTGPQLMEQDISEQVRLGARVYTREKREGEARHDQR